MKKITNLFLTILTISLLNSCQLLDSDKEQVVSIENKYSLSMPAFLTKANDLNDEASLQYQNTLKEFYVIVLDEPKSQLGKSLVDNGLDETYSDDIKGYSELLANGLKTGLSVSNVPEFKDTTINNMPARLLSLKGKVKALDVAYKVAFIEGKERYYQVMSWTLLSKELMYREKMDKILYSLKEL